MRTGPVLTTARQAMRALDKLADPASVPVLQRYFKTGPGEYAEGDVFIGVRTPQVRAVARRVDGLAFDDLERLFDSPVHEHRHVALHILSRSFAASRQRILSTNPSARAASTITFGPCTGVGSTTGTWWMFLRIGYLGSTSVIVTDRR